MKKIFGEINLTWKKLIIFSIIVGIYTGIMALLPITKNTSFEDISITFEVWILFGILIIMNSKSAKDSALKCFIFFLISQPLVYLVQVPFSRLGFGILNYYRNWIVWTLLTIPMGFIGYYMKKDKWWSLLILTPMLLFLGIHYSRFLNETIFYFPYHLLSFLFCTITLIIYPLVIFKNKKIKTIGAIISTIIIIVMSIISLNNRTVYKTTLLINGGSSGVSFDDSYKVYLEDKKYGNVHIEYISAIEEYSVEAEFKKGGKTKLILEDKTGNKTIFSLDIKRDSFDIEREKE